ncbi:MAG TPA: hypothetical protein VK168_09175, partial [Saprospiraceae bacterium]|nr:hypothetical protein [Saprospiraceae bacterium]
VGANSNYQNASFSSEFGAFLFWSLPIPNRAKKLAYTDGNGSSRVLGTNSNWQSGCLISRFFDFFA